MSWASNPLCQKEEEDATCMFVPKKRRRNIHVCAKKKKTQHACFGKELSAEGTSKDTLVPSRT
jgi:hypothetical protein